MRVRLLLLLLVLLAIPCARAQEVRWGRVTNDDLARTAGADTAATAVILADVGKVSYNDDANLVFERHRRVKLLTAAGVERFSTVEIHYFDGDDRVEDVEAQTFVPGPSGPQRTALRRADVFRDRVTGRLRSVRFTLPAVAPGAVIEYRYKLISENVFALPNWDFQDSEPTLRSDFTADIPEGLVFSLVNKAASNEWLPGAPREQTIMGPAGRARRFRWVMENVPALREEPFMTAARDYTSGISFQIAGFNVPGWGNQNVLRTWAGVTDALMGSEGLYRTALRDDDGVAAQARAVAASLATPAEKVQALYDFVRRTVAYSGEMGVYVSRGNATVLRDRRGTSAEVNLLLVGLLGSLGLDAAPALISTRDHGRMQPAYAIVDQFNDLLAYVVVDGQPMFLDATDPVRPATLLPPHSLNGQAWVVKGREGTWVPLNTRGSARRVLNVTATLDAQGTVTGRATSSDIEYAALALRRALGSTSDETAFVRDEVLQPAEAVTVTAPVIHDRDAPDKPLATEATFELPGYAQAAGDLVTLVPVMFSREDTNPLSAPTRTFPVDLGYGRDRSYVLDLTLPAGFEVAEVPAQKTLSLAGGGATYVRAVRVEGNRVQMRMRFALPQAVFAPERYAALRQFWSDVVALEAEPLVLRRTAPGSGGQP